MITSNSLTELADQIRLAHAESRAADHVAIDRAIQAGTMLVAAKEQCAHGDWLPFLARAEMHERQAQRLMRLALSCLKPDTVSDLGGIRAALQFIVQRKLPGNGEVLLVSLDGFDPHRGEPMGIIWPEPAHPGHYHVGTIDLRPGSASVAVTKKPCPSDTRIVGSMLFNVLWATLDEQLSHRHLEMQFQIAPERVAMDDEMKALFAWARGDD